MVLLGVASTSACAGPALRVIGPNGEVRAEFTLEELRKMPQHEIVTGNEFVEGTPTFRGPLVRDVLAAAGLDGVARVRLVAANDYVVEVDTEEFRTYDAILALTQDGRPLTRRDKGPIWMMYPISDHPELQDPVYNSRLIWQLVRIEAM